MRGERSEEAPRTTRRKWPWIVGIPLLGIVLVLASSPLWFPPLAVRLAGRAGLTVASMQRIGGTMFEVRGVEGRVGAVEVRAEEVRLPQPLTWLAGLWRTARGTEATQVEVRGWAVVVDRTAAERAEASPGAGSAPAALDRVTAALEPLRWAGGPIELLDGVVTAGRVRLELPRVRVRPDGIEARVGQGGPITLTLLQAGGGTMDLAARWPERGWTVEGTLTPSGADWRLEGGFRDPTNRVDFGAVFGPDEWIPREARVAGTNLQVDLPERFGGRVEAGLEVDWREGQGRVALHAGGMTRWVVASAPGALKAQLEGGFTLTNATLRTLQIESLPVRLSLGEPLVIPFASEGALPELRLAALARLDALMGPDWSGTVEGHVRPEYRTDTPGPMAFEVRGAGIRYRQWAVRELEVRGTVSGSRLEDVRIRASGPEGWLLGVEGAGDWPAGVVDEVRWTFSGPLPPALPLPPLLQVPLRAEGRLSGVFPALDHTGEVTATEAVERPGGALFRWNVRWAGRGIERLTGRVEAASAESRVTAEVAVRPTGAAGNVVEALDLEVSAAEVRDADRVALALIEPFTATWRGERAGGPRLVVPTMRWSGDAGRLSAGLTLDHGHLAEAAGELEEFRPGFLDHWIHAPRLDLRQWRVDRLSLRAADEEDILTGRLEWKAALEVPDLGALATTGAAELRDGLTLAGVRVGMGEAEPLAVEATLPLRVRRARKAAPTLEWIPAGALSGTLSVPPGAAVWPWVARQGVVLEGARVSARLGGTGADPRVSLQAAVTRADVWVPGATNAWPPIEGVTLAADLDRGHAEVEGQAAVAGQQVRLIGRLPVAPGEAQEGWRRWWNPDLSAAEGRLLIAEADLAPFVEPWRDLLLAAGRVRADVAWTAGRAAGWLEIDGASFRPLAGLGSVRDVTARVELAGDTLRLTRGSVLLNGQPVALSGDAAFPLRADSPLHLRVHGTNVAVARTAEAVLRADVDLALRRTNATLQAVGDVHLRESMILIDVRDLVSVDLERAERRPPYFSVTRPPFLAAAELDVRVHGDRFGRVVSPAFEGRLSADARLQGTLRHPRLVGSFAADGGQVIFPFGRLTLEQARVRFSETDPYRPVLEGRAEGMNFGYTVALELSGTLTEPEIQLSALPPLSTGEIVQMLTAGVVPRGEYAFSDSSKVQRVGTYLARDLIGTLLGNRSGESRLTMRSGQNVSSNGRLTYGIEYQLSERWFLVGEYDRWSQVNAGVRWRLLQR